MANQTLSMPSANAEPVSKAQPAKPERTIPLLLKRGFWAKPGTEYTDDKGVSHVVTDTNDERKRKSEKLLPGYRVTLPVGEAKPLLDGGKAELDAY